MGKKPFARLEESTSLNLEADLTEGSSEDVDSGVVLNRREMSKILVGSIGATVFSTVSAVNGITKYLDERDQMEKTLVRREWLLERGIKISLLDNSETIDGINYTALTKEEGMKCLASIMDELIKYPVELLLILGIERIYIVDEISFVNDGGFNVYVPCLRGGMVLPAARSLLIAANLPDGYPVSREGVLHNLIADKIVHLYSEKFNDKVLDRSLDTSSRVKCDLAEEGFYNTLGVLANQPRGLTAIMLGLSVDELVVQQGIGFIDEYDAFKSFILDKDNGFGEFYFDYLRQGRLGEGYWS